MRQVSNLQKAGSTTTSLNNMARLVIAAPVINKDLYEVVKRFKLPINLLMVDGDRCIYLGNG